MRLKVHIETGDLGIRAGVVHTTIQHPNEINIFVDLDRLADKEGDILRNLIMGQIDLGLYALLHGLDIDAARLFTNLGEEKGAVDGTR